MFYVDFGTDVGIQFAYLLHFAHLIVKTADICHDYTIVNTFPIRL